MTTTQQIEFVGLDGIKCDLVDYMGDDYSVVRSARVSYAKDDPGVFFDVSQQTIDELNRAKGLVNMLMRDHHGTPFEHNSITFMVTAPIFVVREHHRHRVGHSYNEASGRYTKMAPQVYLPDAVRMEPPKVEGERTPVYATVDAPVGLTTAVRCSLERFYKSAFDEYHYLLGLGVKREMARIVLPLATMTRYYWTCNARSLMHFLNLRNAPDAQFEIRHLAQQVEARFADLFPVTHEAFVRHGRVAP
jgi:thymidylate synthase (FAD)